jgi:hypothetical protein
MLIRLTDYMKAPNLLAKPYKGVVVDNVDPEKLSRVKCTIEGLLVGEVADLPWVSSTNDPNALDVPEIGDELKIVFPFNDIYSPEYEGYYHSQTNHNADFDTNYPETFGISKGGLKALHNKETNQSDIIHPNGSTLKATDDGTLEINISKDLKLTVVGEYSVTSTGDIKFSSDATVTLTAVGGIDMSTDAEAKFVGTAGTTIGSPSSISKVEGSVVLLAGGGLPVGLLTSQSIGVGNMGALVVSQLISGSSKVLAPK